MSTTFSTTLCESLEQRNLLTFTAWQPLTLNFTGPATNELATAPNPFTDYRFDVTFTHDADKIAFKVPGFFGGDGKGGGSGNVWRVNFTPDRPGDWTWSASFRAGTNVAVDLNPAAGTPTAFNGRTGVLDVEPPDTDAPGFLGRGKLGYTGGHYYETLDGKPWVKGGANSPENFLGYSGFDNTPLGEHDYASHAADWKAGDPDWGNGKGKAIIGALNYLAGAGVNSIFMLPMNIGGDGADTWPFAGTIDPSGDPKNDNLHYDLSKLAQWGAVFDHAQAKGLMVHMVLMEAEGENKNELDNATLGTERMLFYREMVARYGHLNALQWNISEEYNYKLPLDPELIKSFAGYVQAIDPYDHPITVHNYSSVTAFDPFLGDPRFSATSFQTSASDAGKGATVEAYRAKSTAAGRPIPIMLDEAKSTSTTNQASQRKDLLWPTLLSGGGVEFYVGGEDASLEDFRKYDALWNWTGIATRFMNENLPYDQMSPADTLLTGETSALGQVFAKAGSVYAAYLPNATATGLLDLSNAQGDFSLRWFNPRTGAFEGTVKTLAGGAARTLGAAPGTTTDDWVAVVSLAVAETPDEVQAKPAAPADVVVTLVGDVVRLTWRNTAYGNNAALVIERANETTGRTFTPLMVVAADRTAQDDAGVELSTQYAYRIRAFNDARASGYSNVARVITPSPQIVLAPSAPTALTATANGTSRIDLKWNDVSSDETHFIVERSTSASGTFAAVATLSANTTSYADTGLGASTTYAYRVRARSAAGQSEPSAVATAKTAAPPAPAPTFGVTRLILVDATTGRDLMTLVNGSTIRFAAFGTTKLNVRAEVAGAVESVRFALDKSSDYRTENDPIYSLAGDTDGIYKSWTPAKGAHTLAATGYTKDRAGGTASSVLSINFAVVA